MLTIAARFEAPLNHQKVTGLYLFSHFFGELKALSKLSGAEVFVGPSLFVFIHWLYCITVSNLLKSYLGWDMMKHHETDTRRVQKWVQCSYHLSGVQCTVLEVDTTSLTWPNLFTPAQSLFFGGESHSHFGSKMLSIPFHDIPGTLRLSQRFVGIFVHGSLSQDTNRYPYIIFAVCF